MKTQIIRKYHLFLIGQRIKVYSCESDKGTKCTVVKRTKDQSVPLWIGQRIKVYPCESDKGSKCTVVSRTSKFKNRGSNGTTSEVTLRIMAGLLLIDSKA